MFAIPCHMTQCAAPKLRIVGFVIDTTTTKRAQRLGERPRVVKFAQAHGSPIIGGPSERTESGALLSYGVNQAANYRCALYYVGRILKGTKPSDLPIESNRSVQWTECL